MDKEVPFLSKKITRRVLISGAVYAAGGLAAATIFGCSENGTPIQQTTQGTTPELPEITPTPSPKTPEQELKEMVDRKFVQAQEVAKQWIDLLVAGKIEEAYQLQLEREEYAAEPGDRLFRYHHLDDSRRHLNYFRECSIDLQKGEFKWLGSAPYSTSVNLTPPKDEVERLNRERGLNREKWLREPDEERYTIRYEYAYRPAYDGWMGDRRDAFSKYQGTITLHDVNGRLYVVNSTRLSC